MFDHRVGQVTISVSIEYITLNVLLGRAEGLEGDADALAELFVHHGGTREDKGGIDTGGAAYFKTWPVPFL